LIDTSPSARNHLGTPSGHDTSRRWLLIDALLEGRVRDDCSLGEVAGNLRLPKNGPFVVIAAEVRSDHVEPLTAIGSKLHSVDVYSAWQLLPDWQVGIVRVKSEQQLDKVVALVSRTAVDRVGISAQFDDLRETPQALHFAKMTLLGGPTRIPQSRCSTAPSWPPPHSPHQG
jgi:hypothetical protein